MRSLLSRHVTVALIATAVWGCDFGLGGGTGGCLRVSQGDYTFPSKRIIPASVAARVTQSGLDFLTARVKSLILSFFDADADGRAVVPLSALGLGAISTSLGPFDASARDLVVTIDLSRLDVRLVPGSSPARLEATILDAEVGLVSGRVTGAIDSFFTGDAACSLANGPDSRVALLSMTLALALATDAESRLQVKVLPSTFDLQDIALTVGTDCDLPECLDGLAPGSTDECLECETICPFVDLGAELADLLQDALDGLIDDLLNLLADDLANLVLDNVLNGRPLAIEGQLSLADMLSGMLGWTRSARPLGVLARPAGDAFRVTGAGPSLGLELVFDAGLDAAPPHPSVEPVGTDREWRASPRPTFDGLAVGADGVEVPYDVGIGVSGAILNEALWALWKAGVLSIDVTTEDLLALGGGRLLVTAGTLDLLLPGLAEIAGPDAPIRFSVRPRLDVDSQPGDVVVIGSDPLVSVDLADATIAVDALVGDAWMRMVSFRAGLRLGVALAPTADAKIEVSIGKVELLNLSLPDNEIFRSARLDVVAPFVVDLALSFLSERPLTFDLGLSGLGTALGVPLVPVVVGLGPAGVAGDWLAIYVRLEDAPPPEMATPRLGATRRPGGAGLPMAAAVFPSEVDEAPPEPEPADPGCAGGDLAAGAAAAMMVVLVRRRVARLKVS